MSTMSTRNEAIRFINLELQARPDHDSAPLVPAIVDILLDNPDLLGDLLLQVRFREWQQQHGQVTE